MEKLRIDKHAIIVVPLKSQLPDDLEVMLDEKETELKRTYFPELEELVKKFVVRDDGRRPLHALCVGSQKFTEDKSRGYMGAYSRQAHSDMTGPKGPWAPVLFGNALKMLKARGVSEAEARKMDLMFISAWRPFSYNVKDNPLTLLDWTSVDPDKDVYTLPKGTKLTMGEPIQRVLYNPNHRWLYVPNMTPQEVYVIKQSDSRGDLIPGLAQHAFHTSIRLPGDSGNDRTRRSIVVRMLLLFEPDPRASAAAAKL